MSAAEFFDRWDAAAARGAAANLGPHDVQEASSIRRTGREVVATADPDVYLLIDTRQTGGVVREAGHRLSVAVFSEDGLVTWSRWLVLPTLEAARDAAAAAAPDIRRAGGPLDCYAVAADLVGHAGQQVARVQLIGWSAGDRIDSLRAAAAPAKPLLGADTLRLVERSHPVGGEQLLLAPSRVAAQAEVGR